MALDSITAFFGAVKNRLAVPLNAQHQLLTYDGEGFNAEPVIRRVGIVETQEELDFQQGATEPFDEVFDSWKRISRLHPDNGNAENTDRYSDEAIADELNTWEYDSDNNQVVCQDNTTSLVGFIAPESFEDFIFEVQFTSSGNDDDWIGVCIAYAEDEDGNTHTLDVMWCLHGEAPVTIVKDRMIFEDDDGSLINGIWHLNITDGLRWSDGTEADGSTVENGANDGWGSLSTGPTVKVTRRGDEITVETTQLDESDYYDPATTTFTLNDDPELEVFKGPQRFGYLCRSQDSATWNTLQRPGARDPIIDTRDLTYYTYEDGEWVEQGSGLSALTDDDIISTSALHFNPTTERYYILHDDTLKRVKALGRYHE